MKACIIVLTAFFLTGCLASSNQIKVAGQPSLSNAEVEVLKKYNIVSSEQYASALTESETYNLPKNFDGVIMLEKYKIAAAKEDLPVKEYIDEQSKRKLEIKKKQTEMLRRLRANGNSVKSLNLDEPIYLSCARIVRRSSDGASTVDRNYITLKNRTLDNIEIWNAFNTSVAGQINYGDSLFDAPIRVNQSVISALKKGDAYSDPRNNIALKKDTLVLTHNEYIDYSLGQQPRPKYANNTYSYSCDFSSPETIDWQKKTALNVRKTN